MSEFSDLSELLTGAIVAQASVTGVVHADQLGGDPSGAGDFVGGYPSQL